MRTLSGLGVDAGEMDAVLGLVQLHAVKAAIEIEMPPGAAELAVGRKLAARSPPASDDLLDLAVFGLLELRRGDLGLVLALLPRLLSAAAACAGGCRRGRRGTAPFVRGLAASDLPHTSSASSTISRSFAHCSSSVRTLPSSVEAKPHCGERQNWSRSANLAASSMRRLTSSFFSSVPDLRGDEAEHDDLLALGQEAQRLEAAGALGVVFEEIAVVVDACRAASRPPARSRPRRSRWSGNCRGRYGW